MKNSWIVYGCIGFLMACGSPVEKKEGSNGAPLSIKQQTKVKSETGTKVDIGNSGANTGVSSELETEKVSDAETEQPEKDLAIAVRPSAEVEKETVITIKRKSREKEEPVAIGKKALSKAGVPKDTLIIMSVVPDMMKFNTDLIEVKAGQKVVVELENLDGMQHNMLIIMPGTLEKVGAAADALARDPKGAQKHYVPDSPDVLYSTKLLNPNDIATLTFTAPEEPGEYPFVCTFPGHWRMMKGIMKVTK